MPNITGNIRFGPSHGVSSAGAFWYTNQLGSPHGTENDYWPTVTAYFDASRSSGIYGRSSTVQPASIKVRFYTRYQ